MNFASSRNVPRDARDDTARATTECPAFLTPSTISWSVVVLPVPERPRKIMTRFLLSHTCRTAFFCSADSHSRPICPPGLSGATFPRPPRAYSSTLRSSFRTSCVLTHFCPSIVARIMSGRSSCAFKPSTDTLPTPCFSASVSTSRSSTTLFRTSRCFKAQSNAAALSSMASRPVWSWLLTCVNLSASSSPGFSRAIHRAWSSSGES